ncbi:ComEC/Rec2 family competence protein [Candidatus Neomarinimicrobiota bacterium]
MINRFVTSFSILSIVFTFSTTDAQTVGEVLPPWTPGTLDIHQINTGKGDAALFIFPDGTTLLVDAGAMDPTSSRTTGPRTTPTRPNDTRTPGEWIVRYIEHMLAYESQPVLDYALLTHFHGDHMGVPFEQAPMSSSGQYQLVGITTIGEQVPIRKMLDRGWPNYDYPDTNRSDMMRNYRAFLKQQMESNSLQVERLQPGRSDQIVLVHKAGDYQNFEVRNIAANGEIWTGVGTNTRSYFPPIEYLQPGERPSENMCSIAFRLSYGKFDYFTGGDIPGLLELGAPVWYDVETPVAQAVGPVEVQVLNHHGNRDSQNEFFISALRPRIYIIPVWSSDHPGYGVIRRMLSTQLYPGPRDVFATNMMEVNRLVVGTLLDRLTSDQGHILVRVAPGGDQYRVIILDDSAETYRVKAVHGPYQSR